MVNLNAVKLAAWLHDVIYDSKASDNEERSAEYAERLSEKLSIPEGRMVASLILKTKTHEAGDGLDAQVLIDADHSGHAQERRPDPDRSARRLAGWRLTGDHRLRLLHLLVRPGRGRATPAARHRAGTDSADPRGGGTAHDADFGGSTEVRKWIADFHRTPTIRVTLYEYVRALLDAIRMDRGDRYRLNTKQ